MAEERSQTCELVARPLSIRPDRVRLAGGGATIPASQYATMRYLVLIYSAASDDPAGGTAEEAAMMAGYRAFGEEAGRRGAIETGERLRPVATAKTVRVRNGKTTAVDGPFAETKEQLGGYYVLNCKSMDEAVELAAMIPGALHGSIEVRPIWAMEE